MAKTLASFFSIDANIDMDPTAAAAKSLLNTGAISMATTGGATGKITNLTAGTVSSDAVNKGQLDAAVAGLSWQEPVSAKDYLGTRTIAEINALSPTAGQTVVAGDAGTPSAGTSDALVAGSVAEFDGTQWQQIVAGSGGFVPDGTRLHVHDETVTLFAPLTDGADETKLADFDGTTNTPTLTSPSDGWAFLVVGETSINENKGWVYDAGSTAWIQFTGTGVTDHGSLTGLGDDDHTQYLLLAGRSGGQTAIGGTDASDNLTLTSTSNGTKGTVTVTDELVLKASTSAGAGTGSLSFASDSNTGIFSDGGDAFAIQTGGTEGLRITSGQQTQVAGQTSGTGSIVSNADPDTGIGLPGSDVLDLITGNSIAVSIDANQAAQFNGQAWSVTTNLTGDAANIATNCNDGNVFDMTLGASSGQLDNPTNQKDGATYVWIIRQDGTGGRTLTYGANFVFPGGTAPALSSAAGEVDLLVAVSDGTNLYADLRTNNAIDADDLANLPTEITELLTVAGLAVTLSQTPITDSNVKIWARGGVMQVSKLLDGTTYDYAISGTAVDFDDSGSTTGDIVNGNEVLVSYEYKA
jgi:hypothetical protein